MKVDVREAYPRRSEAELSLAWSCHASRTPCLVSSGPCHVQASGCSATYTANLLILEELHRCNVAAHPNETMVKLFRSHLGS